MRNTGWIGVLAVVAMTSTAAAQSQDDPERRALIEHAGAARDRGDHAEALSLLRQAAARRMSPSLAIFIAEEERQTGDLLRAIADARVALAGITQNATLANRDTLLEQAGMLMAQLQAATARITVAVPTDCPQGTSVTLNGSPLRESYWRAEVDVLPGAQTVVVEAPGHRVVRERVSITAGRSVVVPVSLVPETPTTTQSPTVPAPTPVTPTAPTESTAPTEPSSGGGAGAGPWVVMGAGALSFALAGVFYGLRQGALSDRDAACGSTEGTCVGNAAAVSQAMQSQDSAGTFNTLTNAALGVGAAAVVGGGLWWLLGRRGESRPAAASVWVAPSREGVTLGWQGRL